jgi:hypothetical protein
MLEAGLIVAYQLPIKRMDGSHPNGCNTSPQEDPEGMLDKIN